MIKQKGLLSLTLLVSFSIFAEQAHEATHPFTKLGNEHLSAFTKKIEKKKDKEKKKKSLFSKMTGLDNPDFTIHPLDEYDRYNLLFNEVLASGKTGKTSTVLDPVSWKDLELLCGDHSKATTMLSKIDRTNTGFGHAYLAYMLTNPTDSIPTLRNRQAIVRTLLEKQNLANAIEKPLKDIKEKESALLCFWKTETNSGNKILINRIYAEQDSWFEPLNNSVLWQETQTDLGHAFNIGFPVFFMPVYAAFLARDCGLTTGSLWTIIKNTPGMIGQFITDSNIPLGSRLAAVGISGIMLGYQGLMVKGGINGQIRYANLLNYLHEQANGVAIVIQTLNSFEKTFKEYPTLKNLEHAQTITDITKENKALSAKLKRLITLLKTNTFKGQQTVFSLKGRVRVAYYLLKEIKQEIAPALYAIGEIDTYLSTAKLYKEFENQRAGYTFASYDEADKAHIVMKDMWNPFVPVEKVVSNSITLGQNMPQNVILTGPNAGGKSTFLKGLATSILMAQTFGIAPVKELSFTPFTKINTYMNITDDTAGGNSLFKSEVLRAQGLLNSVKALDSKKFSLSIMDEMFSGTSPKEGEAASFGVARRLGQIDNSILLLASHFPKLKRLEAQTANFKNYQVRVVRHENGSFSYPFKLEEGAADQNVAIDILKEQGFDASILDDANELLNE